jgi:ubiquinone/menaquinone biosynthesis C-methylase UbiE
MGDVSMLVAGLVGVSGEVVGIERDAASIERAQARVARAGFRNVTFLKTDVNEIVIDQRFDAVVGRFVLMFSLIRFRYCGPFLAWFALVEC